MTEHKPHKWQKEIVAWAGGAKVDHRYGGWADNEWELVPQGTTPAWDNPNYEFRLHDPYREFREAEKRGNVVEYRDFCGDWRPMRPDTGFTADPKNYRIAEPEPKERVVFCKVKSVSENHPYVSRYANVTIDDYGNVIKIEIV